MSSRRIRWVLSRAWTFLGPLVCALPPFFMDVLENRIHLFLSFAGVFTMGVFFFKLVYMLNKITTFLGVVSWIKSVQHAVEFILGLVI